MSLGSYDDNKPSKSVNCNKSVHAIYLTSNVSNMKLTYETLNL